MSQGREEVIIVFHPEDGFADMKGFVSGFDDILWWCKGEEPLVVYETDEEDSTYSVLGIHLGKGAIVS